MMRARLNTRYALSGARQQISLNQLYSDAHSAFSLSAAAATAASAIFSPRRTSMQDRCHAGSNTSSSRGGEESEDEAAGVDDEFCAAFCRLVASLLEEGED